MYGEGKDSRGGLEKRERWVEMEGKGGQGREEEKERVREWRLEST